MISNIIKRRNSLIFKCAYNRKERHKSRKAKNKQTDVKTALGHAHTDQEQIQRSKQERREERKLGVRWAIEQGERAKHRNRLTLPSCQRNDEILRRSLGPYLVRPWASPPPTTPDETRSPSSPLPLPPRTLVYLLPVLPTASTFCLFHAARQRSCGATPLHFWCNCAIPEHHRRPKPCHPVSLLYCRSHENRWCACCLRVYVYVYKPRRGRISAYVCTWGNGRIENDADIFSSNFYSDFGAILSVTYYPSMIMFVVSRTKLKIIRAEYK